MDRSVSGLFIRNWMSEYRIYRYIVYKHFTIHVQRSIGLNSYEKVVHTPPPPKKRKKYIINLEN
jgi:hypothetical protein